jgi:hypothetical protein
MDWEEAALTRESYYCLIFDPGGNDLSYQYCNIIQLNPAGTVIYEMIFIVDYVIISGFIAAGKQ